MSNNVSKLIILITVIIATGSGFMYFKTANEKGALETELTDYSLQVLSLNNDLDEKTEDINDLRDDYQDIETQYDLLESQHDVLREDYDELNTDYIELYADYAEVYADYAEVYTNYTELNYLYTINTELRIGNSLTSYYDYLRYELGPTGSRSNWGYEEESCKFASSLALHDLHRLYWIEAEENYGTDVGEKSYAQAWEVMAKAIVFCESASGDSDTDKIEKVLRFVNSIVDYELEIDDSLRAPVETLSLKSGDCDDFSILVAALLEALDVQTGIGFFENGDSAHAMVLVQLDSLDGYRYWKYDDLTYYDFEPGTWLMIEPQFTIDLQGDDEWFSQWSMYMAVEVDYEKVT